MKPKITWPDGKRFAFTVFDDTDLATLQNVGPVYSFLADLGFRTTKSCWAVRGDAGQGKYAGQTCDDADYRRWLLDLQAQGFEIGWHGSTWQGSCRDGIRAALERFAAIFGHYPTTATNHSGCAEGVYWAGDRLSGWRVPLYQLLTRFKNRGVYRGHVEGDTSFWGDFCRERIKYYRNFVFSDIDTLAACPLMPYHDPQRPYVNYWFASSDGADVRRFNRCLAEQAQDRLEEQGGACIMYTHFACGFLENGRLQPRFAELMTRLARKGGWYVPVAVLLDHLQSISGPATITPAERRRLECKWLLEKIFIGTD